MCGIAGFVGPRAPDALRRMLGVLRHRGPDGEGLWESDAASLGMRRLAIVDLESGHQPFFNEDRTIVCVFNGEIYNHRELRTDLIRAGHEFRSDHADGEVIVHLYETYGLDFLLRLDGMFAVALWNAATRTLVLARDRLGIKPLYFTDRPSGGLAFGSEPKALMTLPGVDLSPDPLALHHYLSYKHLPAPMSAFRAIRQLRAGELMVVAPECASRRIWWTPAAPQSMVRNETEAAETIRDLLSAAVRRQSMADVPCGAYLSGGVDSSTVAALMALHAGRPIETFTLVYDEAIDGKDADRHFAREVAARYGTRHHECRISAADVPDQLQAIVAAFDEPFSGVISTYFLTREMARHVKVALSGDGADEIFASYRPHRLAAGLAAVRRAGRANDVPELVGLADGDQSTVARLAGMSEVDARMALYLRSDQQALALLHPELRREVLGEPSAEMTARLYAQSETADPLNRALLVDQMSMLPDQVLAFVDRLSMAHSLEVRPPFLDHALVTFVNGLPGELKIRQGRVKHILKQAVADLLPAGLVDRPKEGFLMPINRWLLTSLRTLIDDTLGADAVRRSGVLDAAAVRRLVDAHRSEPMRLGDQLWNVIMLQLWAGRFAG